jgi:hypothetical protein
MESTAVRAEFQYLESIDSVSAPWADEGAGPPAAGLARQHQIFLDVLMTVALGRDVAVPQSYALDSGGFLQVATRFLEARDEARARDEHPFRLHLYGAATFEQAVAAMLSRVGAQESPFHSSLAPGMNQAARDGGRVPRSLDELLRSGMIPDPARVALELVTREFSSLPRVPAEPLPGLPGLPDLLAGFASGQSPAARLARSSDSDYVRMVHEVLVRGIRALSSSGPGSFVQRSQLRADTPWPGDHDGRTARDIIGAEAVRLVTAFVDTLYNTVVAASIGIAPVAYTTNVAATEESLTPDSVAQRLALAECDMGSHLPVLPAGPQQAQPQFEMRAGKLGALPGPQVAAALTRLADKTAESGLAALLEQRAARPGESRRAGSDFWKNLGTLRSAIGDRDAPRARRALDRHLRLVARLLGDGASMSVTADGRIELLLASAGSGGAAELIARWAIHQPELIGIVSAAGSAAAGAGRAAATARREIRARRVGYALGRYLDLRTTL